MPLLLTGCAASSGPEFLRIDSSAYHEAFEAALEAGRAHGLPPTLRDRRRGVIETEPRIAGSILEPWRGGNASLGQTMENTIAFQRQRARFEFTAVGFHPPAAGDEPVSGPDTLATTTPGIDLSTYDGELELRVSVQVERAYAPGIRRSTWSRANTTRTTIISPAAGGEPLPSLFWTPVTRDPAFERRLLAAVDRRLHGRTEGSGKPVVTP
ncbi:MAG: hypothetical protein ACYS0G_02780 [Planctomycetota bacterium]